MRQRGVIEALLRPPIELYSATTALLAAAVLFVSPWVFMMPAALGLMAGLAALGFSLWRAADAWYVMRYQLGLTRYKLTRVAPHRLPRLRDRIYLGHGFAWTQQHTQRRIDATRPEAQPYVTPSPAVRAATALLRTLRGTPLAFVAAFFLSSRYWWNPLGEQPDLGGTPVLHGVEPKEVPVGLAQRNRNGHLLVLGTTRVGKTRLLELLVTQDIRDGKVVIVIDPKGDADLMQRVYAEAARAGRLDQLYLFHLGYPEISARYNGIGNFGRVTEVANRATNALPSTGNSAAFKEFAWRFTNIVAQAQVALGQVPTYEALLRDITDIEPLFLRYAEHVLAARGPEDWAMRVDAIVARIEQKKYPVSRALQDRSARMIALVDYLKEAQVDDAVLLGLATAVRYERSFFEKIVASLGPFLEKLTTGETGKLISPDYFDAEDERPIFDWQQVIRQGGIVYVGLDALSDSVVASAVGNAMLADLVSVGGKLYKSGIDPHHPEGAIVLPEVACHFDEVNEIVGPEFVPMVNKLGGAGFMIHAYTQTIPDIEARVGDAAKAQQILGNFNHVVMLRVKNDTTAKFFADQLPEVDVSLLTVISGVTDTDGSTGTDFLSRNEDRTSTQRVPMISASDVMALPQGQAFALLEGNRLFKLRMPLPDTAGDAFVPPSLREVGERMRAKYRTSERWADETDWLSAHPIGLAGAVA
ncbi:type IV conjugative transfer system coupling protein TraD [Denitromonas iodatirespirans]|uniref:Type IV conjugative transfer system coupling protein TraD n=1 Tax=Denitromonas iodatirespirans TaxID=2795389 RepID=A0A944D849_DENI1|nr:type IV conjugative transfer system coupling protein TraD [Denitromonas iodatirespirans]MBT0960342.1 type IV conjugative transfer system coupling protein TraD [Denitromonas iodatirespirans]